MYIAYKLLLTYLFASLIGLFVYDKKGEKNFVFTLTPLLMIDKKGEKSLVYMHVFLALFIKGEKDLCYAYMFCIANRRKRI